MRTVFIVSFRYPRTFEELVGGDCAFLYELIPHITCIPDLDITVVALGYQGTLPYEEKIGIRVVRLPSRGSQNLSLLGLHGLSEVELIEMGSEFGKRAFSFVSKNAKSGDVCVLNDIFENGDINKLKSSGLEVVQICHILASQYTYEYIKDESGGVDSNLKQMPFWLRALIKVLRSRIKSHEALVGVFRFLITKGISRVLPEIVTYPFLRERDSLLRADRVILPTGAMRKFILKAYPEVSADKLIVVPWGVTSPPSRDALLDEIESVRHRYQITEHDLVLMTLSRISPEKGIEQFLYALKLLEDEFPELSEKVVVLICGRPTLPSGTGYLSILKNIAQQFSKVRVRFAGFVSGEEKSAHLYAANVFVLPSKYETFGLAMVEAMRHGLPVIASETDGAQEIVDSSFGRMIPYCSNSEHRLKIKDAIAEIVDLDLRSMGDRAYDKSKNFTWEEVAMKIIGAGV